MSKVGLRGKIRRSLSAEVKLAIVALAALLLGAVELFRYRETDRLLTDVREIEGRRLAASLALGVEAIRAAGDVDDPLVRAALEDFVRHAARDAEVPEVEVVAADGAVVAPFEGISTVSADVASAVADALARDRVVTRADGTAFGFAVPLHASGHDARDALYVRAALTPAAAAVGRISAEFGLGMVVVAIVGVVAFAALLARLVLRPLRALESQAQQLAEGDLAVRSGHRSVEEGNAIVHLGQALDAMAERISRDHEALLISEARYRLAARATRDAMYDWDIANDRTFWSEGMQLLFGHAPGEVGPGIEWWKQYIHPDDRAAMLRSIAATMSAGMHEWRAEYRFLRSDGSYAWVQDRGYIDYTSDGSPIRAVGAMTDVTEQRRAEAAFRRQVGFVRLGREVATTANEASVVEDAIRATLGLVCRHTGWPVGHAILLRRTDGDGAHASLWHLDDPERYAETRRQGDATPIRRGVGAIGRVWEQGEPVWVPAHRARPSRPSAASASDLRGVFAFPVLVGSEIVGVLEFFSESDAPPSDDVVAVMAGIGTQLGRVIERAEAEEHLRESAERLEALSRRLLAAQETERRHVARELHDEIGQSLTALKLNLQALARPDEGRKQALIDDSLAVVDRTLQQTRDLSLDLRPAVLDDLGLVPALRWYLDRQGRRAGYSTELAASALEGGVPPDVATTCFRIAQEALTNVARHAHASHVALHLTRRADSLELLVRDDGRGFDPEQVLARAERGESLGLVGMRERAALVGGTLFLDSTPGRGTAVRVVLPLPAEVCAAEPIAHRRSA